MTPPLVRARGVARRYGDVVALAPTDVELVAGETVALVGPNGAGKSTLLSILAGALEPSEGTVESRGHVGWVPQRPAHYARLTARENLELFAELEGVSPSRAGELLARFELPDDGRASGALSVGNRQRLNVAMSLLGDPSVLLLDEPTRSLDDDAAGRLWAALERRSDLAVLIATHRAEDVARCGRRLQLGDP